MIMTEYTSARGGATIDELLIISGEPPVRGDIGAIKTGIRVYRTPDSADKGRVSKTRERIVGAICKSTFGFGIEDLESRYDRTLAKFPALAPAVSSGDISESAPSVKGCVSGSPPDGRVRHAVRGQSVGVISSPSVRQ